MRNFEIRVTVSKVINIKCVSAIYSGVPLDKELDNRQGALSPGMTAITIILVLIILLIITAPQPLLSAAGCKATCVLWCY